MLPLAGWGGGMGGDIGDSSLVLPWLHTELAQNSSGSSQPILDRQSWPKEVLNSIFAPNPAGSEHSLGCWPWLVDCPRSPRSTLGSQLLLGIPKVKPPFGWTQAVPPVFLQVPAAAGVQGAVLGWFILGSLRIGFI